MRNFLCLSTLLVIGLTLSAQSPTITSWLQNTSETGSYYVSGNPTTISNNILVNCQQVEYSDDYVYVTCTGVPSYPTGPFLDGNQSQAENQNAIYKFPLEPEAWNGAPFTTTPGNIGVFINGVSLFDFRDGVAWNSNTNALCGGPGNPQCPSLVMEWNRDAVPAEMEGFDCSKGHPAMGNYHHHQNPSAFDLDQVVVYDICNIYDADGLYAINETQHSPLIGFAYDGFPIYGAYGFANNDGTGGITRIKSGYQLRNISERTHHADGTDVDDGPPVNATYFLGYFREDYEFVNNAADDYLDEHNGRFCVTPEYPDGTYAYFCTVDENWNSAYPYAVGPTFYGESMDVSVNSVDENTTVYTGTTSLLDLEKINLEIFPNPASDLLIIQAEALVFENLNVHLLDMRGRVVEETQIKKGSTLAFFDVQSIYEGSYVLRIFADGFEENKQVIIKH